MRKMILALAVVLLAAPAWAAVTLTVTKISDTKVAINYNATTESQLVRAFALDVNVAGGTIVDINDYAVGDDNHGYGIFPGNFSLYITVLPNGTVDNWDDPNYTPVAPADDPGALGGIGTAGATLEMGSLYDTNAPAKTGVLCTVTVSAGTTELHVNGNAIRGNIVMEDAAEVPVTEVIYKFVTDCFPNTFTTYADWVSYGKPDCWCNSAVKATAKGDYQCDGDASGNPYLTTGWRVYTDDLNIVAANWKRKMAPAAPAADPCADISHKGYLTTGWRVYTDDLNIVAANWKKKAGTPPTGLAGNCGLLSRPQ